MSGCEAQCSSYGWCIGFSNRNADGICKLMTSTGVCTVGSALSGNVATSIDQLQASTAPGWNCMGKISTGNNKV